MRIVVSSDSDSVLESSVSHHFGRCPFFTVIDIENNEITHAKAVENPYFNAHSPGQVPAFIKELGADVMITGGMGGRAIRLFGSYGIECSTGALGSVRSAVMQCISGNLSAPAPCRESVEHGHGLSEYESNSVDRLKEEAAYLLDKLNDIIVQLPDRND